MSVELQFNSQLDRCVSMLMVFVVMSCFLVHEVSILSADVNWRISKSGINHLLDQCFYAWFLLNKAFGEK